MGFLPHQREQMFPYYFFLRVVKTNETDFFISKNLKLFSESIKKHANACEGKNILCSILLGSVPTKRHYLQVCLLVLS